MKRMLIFILLLPNLCYGVTSRISTVRKVKAFERVFALLERYRRQWRISRLTVVEEPLKRETGDEEFARLLEDQSKQNRDISEDEAMELASEAVAWSRKKIGQARKGR